MTTGPKNLRVEARDLKPYAEPVSKKDLKEGEVYFSVQFADENLLVPIMHPFIYIGKNLDGDNTDLFYFQDFDAYSAGVRWPPTSAEEQTAFEAYGPDGGQHLFEFEQALDRLLVCSLRRRGSR